MTSQLPIVFISAMGQPGRYWQPVLDHLPGHTTITYDRPGIGATPHRPPPNPPLPYSAFADELAAHLDHRDITGPAVIVGHSIGSLIARVYAARHAHRVAGIVHVDGSLPQFYVVPGTETPEDGADGDTDATAIDIVNGQVEVLYATAPAAPTLVLVRSPGHWAPGPPPPGADELWLASQRILARDAGTALIVAEHSGHGIPHDQPELVAYAVRAVHDAAAERRAVRLDAEALAAVGGHLDKP
ncbi:alpha/beta fold hydrolase [Actinoplanes sp. NPDC020271]|uniref:alpha/beta fold hydrolase n=1 Tax=Actinoplanes sp. NPDC020271 TaxID=3363896 RepID=UPI0037B2631A